MTGVQTCALPISLNIKWFRKARAVTNRKSGEITNAKIMSTVLGPHLEVACKRDAVPDPKDLGTEEATVVLGQKTGKDKWRNRAIFARWFFQRSSSCSLKY